MKKSVQYTNLTLSTSQKDIQEIMDEIYEILSNLGAKDITTAKESEVIAGQLHTNKNIKNLINAKNTDCEKWTIPSIVGAIAGAMTERGLDILRKVDKRGEEKVKWYIKGNKQNIHDEKLWKKKGVY